MYKLILTGSPILNGYEDLWAQMAILNPDILGDNFFAFRARHFYNANAGKRWLNWPDWKVKPESIPYFQKILADHTHRVTKEEVLELPPLVRQTVFVDLTPELEKHYKEMERDFLTVIDSKSFGWGGGAGPSSGVLSADIVLTKLLRLQQIVSGVLQLEDKVHRLACAKLDALSELLEDLCPRNKVIVWSNFIHTHADIADTCDRLGLSFASIVGGQSPKERQEQVDAFNNTDRYSVCIANQQAGGVGIGLQAASYAIFYSRTWNLEHDLQSRARNYRAGSERHKSVTHIDIVTRGTIEEQIVAALEQKLELSELVLAFKKMRQAA